MLPYNLLANCSAVCTRPNSQNLTSHILFLEWYINAFAFLGYLAGILKSFMVFILNITNSLFVCFIYAVYFGLLVKLFTLVTVIKKTEHLPGSMNTICS